MKGNMWLSYGELITKILEHCGFDFEKEESEENSTRIGRHTLGQM